MKPFLMNKNLFQCQKKFLKKKKFLYSMKKIRKEESEKFRNEDEQLIKNNVVKDVAIKESIKIKSLEENKNVTDSYLYWFDKNKFKNILATSDSNTFNDRRKINSSILTLETWLIDITVSEISAKKDLNTLNEIKNEGITKQRKRTPKQKELLNFFNDLSDTILTDNTILIIR